MLSFIAKDQLYAQEHKVVCNRAEGCPVVNGTCPTCTIVANGVRLQSDEELEAWGKRLKERLRYQWDHKYYSNKSNKKKRNVLEWKGPYWNGLRVFEN